MHNRTPISRKHRFSNGQTYIGPIHPSMTCNVKLRYVMYTYAKEVHKYTSSYTSVHRSVKIKITLRIGIIVRRGRPAIRIRCTVVHTKSAQPYIEECMDDYDCIVMNMHVKDQCPPPACTWSKAWSCIIRKMNICD